MDTEIQHEFHALHQKIDQHHEAVMQRFHGERGDNGLYGRVGILEERDRARVKREGWLWSLAGSSGVATLLSWIMGHK